jgi:hypothetical protein
MLLLNIPEGVIYCPDTEKTDDTPVNSKNQVRIGAFLIDLDNIRMPDFIKMRMVLPAKQYMTLKIRISSRAVRMRN